MRKKSEPRARTKRFQMGELHRFEPALLLSKNPTSTERFFLGLAVAFNDLLDTFHFFGMLSEYEVPEGVNAERGQYEGMAVGLARRAAGIVYEVLELVGDSKDVLAGEEYKEVLKRLVPEELECWNAVVDVAFDPTTDRRDTEATSVRNALRRVRHKAVFHYTATHVLARGFSKHFFEAPPTDFNRHAMLAQAKSAHGTRLFYADAAAAAVAAVETGENSEFWHETVRDLASTFNHGLKPLIFEWIASRYEKSAVA